MCDFKFFKNLVRSNLVHLLCV